jgi:hypothetical protein
VGTTIFLYLKNARKKTHLLKRGRFTPLICVSTETWQVHQIHLNFAKSRIWMFGGRKWSCNNQWKIISFVQKLICQTGKVDFYWLAISNLAMKTILWRVMQKRWNYYVNWKAESVSNNKTITTKCWSNMIQFGSNMQRSKFFLTICREINIILCK